MQPQFFKVKGYAEFILCFRPIACGFLHCSENVLAESHLEGCPRKSCAVRQAILLNLFFHFIISGRKCHISPSLPHVSLCSGRIYSHRQQTKCHRVHILTPAHVSVNPEIFLTSQRNKHHDSRKAEETPVSSCRLTFTPLFFFNWTNDLVAPF